MIRRIDELGRIVIPKEIRKTLGIKNGENLEIFLDQNRICLQKYSTLYSLNEKSSFFVDVCQRELGMNLIIMDLEKVIASFDESLNGSRYPFVFTEKLENREEYSSLNIEEYFRGYLGYYLFIPFILNGDLLGGFVLFSVNEIEEREKKLLRFLTCLFIQDIS